LTNAELIKNTGYIFFDYNPAIVTNTVSTANQKGLGIFTPSVSAGKLAIFPNPAENIIKIEVEDTDFKEGNLSIYDLSGRLLLTKFIANKTSLVNVNLLNAGEYICTLKSSDNKVFVNKFVKL
jgi:Secretion system C-terminal sorting domain